MGRKAKTTDETVLELARQRIAHAYDIFDTIIVSFSGGKDSTVCLNLALEEAERRKTLPLRVVFFDEEAIPMETEDYVRRVANDPRVDMQWYCVPVVHRNGASRKRPYWYPWAEEDRGKWVREIPPEAVTAIPGYHPDEPKRRMSIPNLMGLFCPPSLGSVGVIMGIRADESMIRRRAVSNRTVDNYIIHVLDGTAKRHKNVHKVYPIYDWRTSDVWTAPKQFGWDTNRSYDLMEMHGVSPYHQRVGPPYGEEPLARLNTYLTCFPDVAGKMLYRVPGAATAFRYARTELYSYGKRHIEPNPGETWRDATYRYANKFSGAERKHVITTVEDHITSHYQHTSDPLAVHAIHPKTQRSWAMLLMIAVRGDFKGRRSARAKNRDDRVVERYLKERAELERQPGGVFGVTGDVAYLQQRSIRRDHDQTEAST